MLRFLYYKLFSEYHFPRKPGMALVVFQGPAALADGDQQPLSHIDPVWIFQVVQGRQFRHRGLQAIGDPGKGVAPLHDIRDGSGALSRRSGGFGGGGGLRGDGGLRAGRRFGGGFAAVKQDARPEPVQIHIPIYSIHLPFIGVLKARPFLPRAGGLRLLRPILRDPKGIGCQVRIPYRFHSSGLNKNVGSTTFLISFRFSNLLII